MVNSHPLTPTSAHRYLTSQDGRIRTDDLVVPDHAECQTFPRPKSSGRWNRTIDLKVMSLVSCHCSTPQSAQRELNSRLLHGKQMGYHYTMGAD